MSDTAPTSDKDPTTGGELAYLISLGIGDVGGDGHRQDEHIVIRSNLDSVGLLAAYKKGVLVVGVDCMKDVCSEYEDHKLTEEVWQKYIAAGICEAPFEWQKSEPGDAGHGKGIDWIEPEAFVDLFLLTVLRGEPSFLFEFPTSQAESLNIGGYGLFY